MSAIINTLKKNGKLLYNDNVYIIHDNILDEKNSELIKLYKIQNNLKADNRFDYYCWEIKCNILQLKSIIFFSSNIINKKIQLSHKDLLKIINKKNFDISTNIFVYEEDDKIYSSNHSKITINGLNFIFKHSKLIKIEKMTKVFNTFNSYIEENL